MKLNDEILRSFQDKLDRSDNRKQISQAVQEKGVRSVASDPRMFSGVIEDGSEHDKIETWLDVLLNLIKKETGSEVSKTYIMFWIKLEQSAFFLNKVIELKEKDPEDSELFKYLRSPLNVFNGIAFYLDIISKYGIVSKDSMLDVFHTKQPKDLDDILSRKLRQSAALLRRLLKTHNNDALKKGFQKCLNDIYALLVYSFGDPINKAKVKGFDNKFQVLINAPVEGHPLDVGIDLESLIEGSEDYHFFNVSKDRFLDHTLDQLRNGRVVWASCDIVSILRNGPCILDDELLDINETLATSCDLDKGKRIRYGESARPGIIEIESYIDNEDKFKVIFNGQAYAMTSSWFKDHVYMVLLDEFEIKVEQIEKLKFFDPIIELMNT